VAKIQIYTPDYCGYCTRAVRLLTHKGVAFEQIDASNNWELRDWLVEKTGRMTLPQIFVDGVRIGDCDEIHALDRAGKLDALLGIAAA